MIVENWRFLNTGSGNAFFDMVLYIEGIKETLGVDFERVPPSDDEISEAEGLAETKCHSDSWNMRS